MERVAFRLRTENKHIINVSIICFESDYALIRCNYCITIAPAIFVLEESRKTNFESINVREGISFESNECLYSIVILKINREVVKLI